MNNKLTHNKYVIATNCCGHIMNYPSVGGNRVQALLRKRGQGLFDKVANPKTVKQVMHVCSLLFTFVHFCSLLTSSSTQRQWSRLCTFGHTSLKSPHLYNYLYHNNTGARPIERSNYNNHHHTTVLYGYNHHHTTCVCNNQCILILIMRRVCNNQCILIIRRVCSNQCLCTNHIH
jgi:hypothetical protein